MKMIALLLIGVVLGNQAVLTTTEKVSPMSQALLGLAELASSTKDFDFQQLFGALDELAASFQERKVEENELYEVEYNTFLSDISFYSNLITDYQNQVASLEVSVKDLSDERTATQEYLKEKRAELYETQKLLNSKTNQISADQNTYNGQNQDYSDAIATLDAALELLNEVKVGESLLQKKENIKEMSTKIHKRFRELKHKRVFYQPLVKSLLAMCQDNYVDQENLNKVIKFMEDLRASLIDAQRTLTNDFTNQNNQQKAIQADFQNKVNELTNVVIPSIVSQISTQDGELAALKQILQDAQNNLQDAQESLTATQNRWIQRYLFELNQRTANHKSLLESYDNELLAIKDAENALKKGGIFRK